MPANPIGTHAHRHRHWWGVIQAGSTLPVKWRSLAGSFCLLPRGGALRRPPSGPPPAINHPPFSSARGPDRREAGSGASEERRRSRAVWCWPTAKFLQWKSLGGALVPHTQTRDLSALQKAHYPQCELVRARALPVLNSADATSARSLRLRRLLGGRRLDPRAQAAVPLHRPAVFVTVRRPLGLLRLAFIV